MDANRRSEADLDRLEQTILKARKTAEQEVVLAQQQQREVVARQPFISRVAGAMGSLRAANHFGDDYAITMKGKHA